MQISKREKQGNHQLQGEWKILQEKKCEHNSIHGPACIITVMKALNIDLSKKCDLVILESRKEVLRERECVCVCLCERANSPVSMGCQ
jgi:hypothetical protein